MIAGFNRPASVAFGLTEGARMADLPFEPEDIDLLRGVIAKIAGGRAVVRQVEKVITLRMRSKVTGSPVILRVGPIENPKPLALVISTELIWPQGFTETVQEAFGLTMAEVEIVQGITLGQPVKEIAEARGRSADTVRTQLRSILAKTETHSQSELLRVVLGLMDVAVLPYEAAVSVTPQGNLAELPFQQMRGPDGRRLEWIEFGASDGAPCLYMHLDYGLIRWPASAEAEAKRRGIRVIVPVRAGFGRSDLHTKGADNRLAVTRDYCAVLDHLGVKQVAVLAIGADISFAMTLSLERPGLVTGILGCGCTLPLRTPAQYDRMDKWHRFILGNARYAPKILPFLVKAGFGLARRLGKEKFFAQVNGGSPADLATFARSEVREAMLKGSEVCMSDTFLAHEAFSREVIGTEKDWSAVVRAVKVPVVMLQGDQDPQAPMQSIRELALDFPHLDIRFLPDCGQLLFFKEWPQVFEVLDGFLPRGLARR
jgi:pimeloyl-ACP methyl ester carboxylesterase/DNA-binding CsgD family transcriptional regulator